MAPWRTSLSPETLEPGGSASAGVGLFVALTTIAFLLWGFAALADEFNERSSLAQLDLTILNWLQLHGSERGERYFQFVSWLGAPVLAAVDAAVSAWLAIHRAWRTFWLWVITIAGGAVLDEILKLSFRRARPAVAPNSSVELHGVFRAATR